MFRISQYMQEIKQPTPLGPKRNPPGPVVIWNLIRRCNLTCKHCYSISADTDFPGSCRPRKCTRSSTISGVSACRSDPLGRRAADAPGIFDISRRAKQMGIYSRLSTNGTLIDESNIERIAEIGYDYVGTASTTCARPMTVPPSRRRV